MIKVLFVCLGNICRSPMAEFLFKDYLDKLGVLDKFVIESRGTSNWEEGNPVYPGTKEILDKYNIDYSGKTSMQITDEDFIEFDYIIGMDHKNVRNLKDFRNGKYRHKVFQYLEDRDVLDPWYTKDFEATHDDLVSNFDLWYEKIVSEKGLK